MKKKMIIILIFILLVGVVIFSYLYLFKDSYIADTIIYGNIYTGVDGETTSKALAIKDGKYIYVGDEEGVKKYAGKHTQVLNYSDGL